ncbi:MAG: hypothetical protein GKR98_00175 [Boseongicola sp.]|nr:MAG: hypothetical protein GKR98_00175 [Boseongicola sp.]
MADEINTTAEVAEASAMRIGRAVHTNPEGCPPTAEQEPLPDAIARKPVDQKSPAEWAYERLILYIKNFEQTLDNEHEVAMGLTDTGAGVLRIEGLGYFDPDIVTFYGSDMGGARIQLVQHVSQLNVVLRANPKAVAAEPPRRIGFELAESLNEA